jgi:hypothetical protein
VKLREICETPARDLRAMFIVVYSCEHLRTTCESLARDLRVRLASTCVHVRAGVTSCEQPLETLCGQYLHDQNIFKTKLAIARHLSIIGP